MTLTVAEIKSIRCPENKKQIKKYDHNGLFLLIKNTQSKLWRMKFMYAGKHRELSLGKYPNISLAEAREKVEDARQLLAKGINPAQVKQDQKRKSNVGDRAFEIVALKWWEQQKDSWSQEHGKRIKNWIQKDSKSICKLAIDQIDAGLI